VLACPSVYREGFEVVLFCRTSGWRRVRRRT
jgi:hypothetical protein